MLWLFAVPLVSMDTEHLLEIWTVLSATIIKTPNEGCFD